jgi:cytochrome c oxidase subunit 3
MTVQASAVGHDAHEAHWETSWGPMAIAFGLLFLVPVAFVSFFIYGLPLLAIISVGIGTPLVIAGVAVWIFQGATQESVISDVSPMGIGVFIIGEILIFLSLFAGYWAMRITVGAEGGIWPPKGTPEIGTLLPLVMTVILVTSSFTYHQAENAFEAGKSGGYRGWLLISMVLGIVFLGCTTYEYGHLIHEGFVPGTNAYSSAFYSLTGFHGSHVLVGLLSFAALLISSLFGTVNKNFVKVAGIYWHFVDIVWFFVASQVYFW